MRNILWRLVAKIISQFNVYNFIPPYSYTQNIVENNLAEYLGVSSKNIKKIVIVGGYLGNEIPTLLKNYPNVKISVYEPSHRYFSRLQKRFLGNKSVLIRPVAVSALKGEVDFYETNLRGSGSILELGSLAKESYGARQKERFEVQAVTLDDDLPREHIDCLWIDVQGAELHVLAGARNVLTRSSSIFIEVSKHPDLYKGGATMGELEKILFEAGFTYTALGLDRSNQTGNAFFTKAKIKNS